MVGISVTSSSTSLNGIFKAAVVNTIVTCCVLLWTVTTVMGTLAPPAIDIVPPTKSCQLTLEVSLGDDTPTVRFQLPLLPRISEVSTPEIDFLFGSAVGKLSVAVTGPLAEVRFIGLWRSKWLIPLPSRLTVVESLANSRECRDGWTPHPSTSKTETQQRSFEHKPASGSTWNWEKGSKMELSGHGIYSQR